MESGDIVRYQRTVHVAKESVPLKLCELISENPDEELVGRLGMPNAKLSGVQGLFQLGIVALMVLLRWGGL